MDGEDAIPFAGTPRPGGFVVRTLILQPGDAIAYRPGDWADTLVVVERGELEIECHSGTGARFAAGAVLVFAGLPLRCLRNAGGEPLVLGALSRPPAAG
jgi:hypothetical protein